ncbi:Mobile element protein [Methanosarcina vacuolata Z-761]|uniref:Mobile element protein n=1 Tax=Methanosarcina vacuolata Z-761 TaxID=1434123 RepID=A0A0E3Q5A6_9EURY|nr:Mobile element protein [Methanosarcina vacuolata Z-761]
MIITGCLKITLSCTFGLQKSQYLFSLDIYIKVYFLRKNKFSLSCVQKVRSKAAISTPLNLEDFIPEGHISRVVNDLSDVVDINAIESTYSEKGCPAYHPRLLLKI